MNYRRLGKTAFEIAEVGLGAWQLGADWGAPVSEETAFSILQTALDQGCNFIDTADVYGQGRSESLIGRFLKTRSNPNHRVYVATKQGRFAGWAPTYETMKAHAIASLQRLGVESLDLLQLHCIPFETLQQGDVFGHLEKLQREGLIQHAGVSVESVEEALFCLQHPVVSALQVIFNIFRQKLIGELLPQAQDADVGLLARVPLASGLLSGKFSASHQFGQDDHRNYNADGQCFNVGETFAGLPFAAGVALAQEVIALFPTQTSDHPAQYALRWVLDHPVISTVIPGATTPQQVIENSACSNMSPLSQEAHQALQTLYHTKVKHQIRGPY